MAKGRKSATEHRDYDRAVRVGRRLWEQKKGEMPESLQRDYLRIVGRNPNNVPGLPAFYPPDYPRVSLSGTAMDLSEAEHEATMLDRFIRDKLTRKTQLFCRRCDKTTEHGISPAQTFCGKCGKQSPYRMG